MVLIDALYINVGGGKVLLDYLIRELNKKDTIFYYLLDDRITNDHEKIKDNNFKYMGASMIKRHSFYKNNGQKFSKVLCFGNLPPNIRLNAPVLTYFHQPLFLSFDNELPLMQRIKLRMKMVMLSRLVRNSDRWIVQSSLIRERLAKKYRIQKGKIAVIPFYPAITHTGQAVTREKIFLYISSGDVHKNHNRLLDAFTRFYDDHSISALHLTVEKKYVDLFNRIDGLQEMGYPIINHGFLPQQELGALYQRSEYLVFPSLAESFGLGLIEAIENGCKIVGSNRPYMHAVCTPSITFDPESVQEIKGAMETAIFNKIPNSKQLVFDSIKDLTDLLT